MVDLQNTNTDGNIEEENVPPRKKSRLGFSGKEFRNRLKTDERVKALEEFSKLLTEDSKRDYIQNYLIHGGNLLDILQTMEDDSSVSPVLVFDTVNRILLQINAKFPQYQNMAYNSCQYLLNNYITLINKMLSLSSTTKERLVTLKLLTTMATVSVMLAKDILLNVNFKPPNLELLTKVSNKNEVRSAFIHFVMALLVDGHFPTLAMLLEKKGLLASIINGLQYDPADVVVLVVTIMKNHILENPSVSKTVKMKTFNTQMTKAIVNLYNWKGPGSIIDSKKNNKFVDVDEVSKSKVNEALHAFLLVLCASPKFGVIFRDHSIGLGKKQNSLIYTVLESLERPWEHSYAGDLVLKICKSCPNLTKITWVNVRPFLEPRWTVKWQSAMKFANQLLEEVQPDCIASYVNSLNTQQMAQFIQNLVAPSAVIKVIVPENHLYEKPAIKYNVICLLLTMLKSAENYIKFLKKFPQINSEVLQASMANHIVQNFPDANFVLADWNQTDEDCPASDYLESALDYLGKFIILTPNSLKEMELSFDIRDFLSQTESVISGPKLKLFQIKIIKLFLDLEPAHFRPKSEMLENVMKLALQFYYDDKNLTALLVLREILKKSGIFDGFLAEIDLWIDGIFNLKNFDETVPEFLCQLVKTADEEASHYNRKLFEFKNGNFSPLILVVENYIDKIEAHKSLKNYLNFVVLSLFHLQIDCTAFCIVISKLSFLSTDLLNYVNNWKDYEPVVLHKCKGNILVHIQQFSVDFLEGSLENFDFDVYCNFALNLLQTSIFYLTNLIQRGLLKENHRENCKNFFKHLFLKNAFVDDRYIQTVLAHGAIIKKFDVLESKNFVTELITEVVQELKDANVEDYLIEYRRKIVSSLSKVFKKPQKYANCNVSLHILDTFRLEYEDCYRLIEKFVGNEENMSFYNIIAHCLDRTAALVKNDFDLKPLSESSIEKLSHILTVLIKDQDVHRFTSAFLNYLKVFPHSVESVDAKLIDSLLTMTEYHKDNLLLTEFLLERRVEFLESFERHLDEICLKKSFLLSLLHIVIKQNNDTLLQSIYDKFKGHIIKALQKPHKAGQHFQNSYKSVGVLIEKFMNVDEFGTHVQKFEVTELFHVYFLKIIYSKADKNDKNLEHMITTFIHLLMNLLKQKSGGKEVKNLEEIFQIFANFVHDIKISNSDSTLVISTEIFKLFYKLCLKYGVEGDAILLRVLSELVDLCIGEDDGKLILEMFLSHSRFLDVILGDSDRSELLNLWLKLCTKWPQFMEKSHVPVLLSCYRATRKKSDRIALDLLKLYELKQAHTHFHDFKPFLWGQAAVSHYSVRSNVQKVLWRQPKTSDILNTLSESTILNTITDPLSPDSYDLDYFLPLFSHLLAPENPVPVYHFIKSGALALAITGLMGDRDRRLATFYVLSRFHFHLDARQTGKDQLLWLRFVEVICKGLSVLDDFSVNNFVGVFLARTALILTRPLDAMYLPLSQYLSAKDLLDFNTIPELYTFLHSSHVASKDHRHFILEVLRDGLRCEKDFMVLLRSMGFKLISELYCSNPDFATKILILDVFRACCQLPLGVKVLCGSLSFVTQVSGMVFACLQKKEREGGAVLLKLLDILREVVRTDDNRHRNFVIYLDMMALCENDNDFKYLTENKGLDTYYEILLVVIKRFPSFFTAENMDRLLTQSGDKFCKYLLEYKCRFVNETDFSGDENSRYLRLLFYTATNKAP